MEMRRVIRRWAVLTAALALLPYPLLAAEWYAAPDGVAVNSGTKDAPWDLATALAHPKAVQPGDTIWLRGGTYKGAFTSELKGTGKQPLVVRPSPGERATLLLNGMFRVNGGFTTFRDFEITSAEEDEGNYNIYGPGTRFINLVIHDCPNSNGFWSSAVDAEIYGCVMYYNGGRRKFPSGHPYAYDIYTQNETGTKRIANSILFKTYGGWSIHAYTEKGAINNFLIEENIVFDAGATANGYKYNIYIGGGRVAENPKLVNNCTYFSYVTQASGGQNAVIGHGSRGLVVRGNYFAAEKGGAFTLANSPDAALTDNTFIGAVTGFTAAQFPENTYLPARPAGVKIFVRPNQYEKGRAHIAVYNWDKSEAVEADVSAAGLAAGDRYEVRDAQNYFGPPVASGTYAGKPIRIPMNLTAVAAPVAAQKPLTLPYHTAPTFGAFVVLPVGKGDPR